MIWLFIIGSLFLFFFFVMMKDGDKSKEDIKTSFTLSSILIGVIVFIILQLVGFCNLLKDCSNHDNGYDYYDAPRK